ncbi:MAG: hypothetical protein JWP81_3977 [Ferruginibacter sp.]|nr:hypothetical protein [Ferruginibacter sp.]
MISILVVAGFTSLASSCKKSEVAVDKTCKIAFILNLTNAAGDTTFVNGIAGELVQNVPTITRTGFKFDGWYTNSADANPNPTKNTAAPKFPAYNFSVKPIYLDIILYARWIP